MIKSPAITKPTSKQVDRFRKPAVALSFQQQLQKVLKPKISFVLLQELTCGIWGASRTSTPYIPRKRLRENPDDTTSKQVRVRIRLNPPTPGTPPEAMRRGLRQNPHKLGVPCQSLLRKRVRENTQQSQGPPEVLRKGIPPLGRLQAGIRQNPGGPKKPFQEGTDPGMPPPPFPSRRGMGFL